MASNCFKQSKPPKKSHTSNKPWFNWKTRLGKREFRKATDATSKFPSNNLIRKNYYLVKGSYKRLKNSAKINFFTRMNEDIEGGKILNWQSFKKLKNQKKETLNFDSHDMNRFRHVARFFLWGGGGLWRAKRADASKAAAQRAERASCGRGLGAQPPAGSSFGVQFREIGCFRRHLALKKFVLCRTAINWD